MGNGLEQHMMGKEVQHAAKHMTPAWTDHSHQETPQGIPGVKAGNRIDLDSDDLSDGEGVNKTGMSVILSELFYI